MKMGKWLLSLISIFLLLILSIGCLPEKEKEKPKGAEMKIYIIPVGDVEEETLLKLSWALREKFEALFEMGQPLPLSEDAYRAERRQYFATPILEELKQNIPEDGDKVLAVLDVDIFVPALNFIFGQADLGGKVALISLTRLREEFYGNSKNEKLFFDRALKEAVHELGHTFGLTHCPNEKCVMHFSNSLLDTDVKEADFCEECKKKLEIRLK
jgi:archaemetzincin